MHTTRPRARTLIALVSTVTLVALLGASAAAARSPHVPRTATRGPAAVTDYQPRRAAAATDFGWSDGIVAGGFLLALAVAFGYVLSSTRGRGSLETWDPATSDPAAANGRPGPASRASRPATSRS